MITYNDLYETLRKERYSDQLQVLPKSFIRDVSDYFREKKSFLNKEGDLFSEVAIKNKKQLDNAISIFREIIVRRRKKILNLAFVASETGISKRDFEDLLEFEKVLFEEITKSLGNAETDLNRDLSGTQEEKKYKLVKFLEDVSPFMGMEGEEIGPFEKGEISNIEKEIVDILSKDKRVEVIDEE